MTPITPLSATNLPPNMRLALLDGEALAHARSLAAADPQFRAEVARWSGRLAPMLDDVAPVAPPARAWIGIDAVSSAARPAANVIHLNRRVNSWRGIAAGATALAASLAIVLVTQPIGTQAPPVAVASQSPISAALGDDQRDMKLVAS